MHLVSTPCQSTWSTKVYMLESSSLWNSSLITVCYKSLQPSTTGETQTKEGQHKSRPPEEVLLAGVFGSLRLCTVRATFSTWAQRQSCYYFTGSIMESINPQWASSSRNMAHLTLEVIWFLRMEDLGCIPNVTPYAFQPIQVILIHILQERRNSERWLVPTELPIEHLIFAC